MPDYGTKIADFTGKLHDVSKSAFDAIAMRDANKDLREATEPIRERLQKYLDKLGLKVDFTEPGAASKLLKNALTKVAAGYGGKVIASAGATLLGEEVVAASVAGPIGIVLGIAAEAALVAFKSKQDETPTGGYKPGQWVMLDNGTKTVSRKVERAISWGEAAMFGDAPTRFDLELDREEDYSVGFVMGPGPEVSEWTCFNFKTAAEEAFHKSKVRPCDETTAEMLDNNDEMSLIREFKFLEDEEELLAGSVPTRPGSQVMLNGRPYRIVKTEGTQALIENTEGDQIQTSMINLERGNVGSNIGYKNRNGNRVQQGFSAMPLDGIFRGMWAWVVPSLSQRVKYPKIKRSLGIVILLRTNDVKGTYALDGEIFEVGEDQLEPCVLETVEMLAGVKEFRDFKERAVADFPSESELQIHAPGKKYPLVSMGIGQKEGRKKQPRTGKTEAFVARKFKYQGYVGDHGEKDKLDREQEEIEKGHAAAGWKEEQRLFKRTQEASSGQFAVVAICLVAAGYFLLA